MVTVIDKLKKPIVSGPLRKTLCLLALPVLAEQILNTCVAIFDTFLAGQISASATSAIGLAAYVDWLVTMIVMLVATGTTALVARFQGSDNHAEANHLANQSIAMSIMLGIVSMVLIFLCAPAFAWYCNMTNDAYSITVEYLRIAASDWTSGSLLIVS